MLRSGYDHVTWLGQGCYQGRHSLCPASEWRCLQSLGPFSRQPAVPLSGLSPHQSMDLTMLWFPLGVQ